LLPARWSVVLAVRCFCSTSAVYVYDSLARKTSESVDYGNFNLSHSYSYYPNGQKQTYTAPDGTLISYAYTNHGEPERLTIPGVARLFPTALRAELSVVRIGGF